MDSELFPEHYIIYRKDREHTVQHERGGGILMAFKKEIILRRRADLEPDCEIMVCDMQVSNVKKYLLYYVTGRRLLIANFSVLL